LNVLKYVSRHEIVQPPYGMTSLCYRLLAQGDVFPVRTSDAAGSASLLNALSAGPTASAAGVESYTFFKVAKILPQAQCSLVVDSRHTAITLKVPYLCNCLLAAAKLLR